MIEILGRNKGDQHPGGWMKGCRWEVVNSSLTVIPRRPTAPRNGVLRQTCDQPEPRPQVWLQGRDRCINLDENMWMENTQVDRLHKDRSRNSQVSNQHLAGATLDSLEDKLFPVPLSLKVVSWLSTGATFQPSSAFQSTTPQGLTTAHTRSACHLRESAQPLFLVWAIRALTQFHPEKWCQGNGNATKGWLLMARAAKSVENNAKDKKRIMQKCWTGRGRGWGGEMAGQKLKETSLATIAGPGEHKPKKTKIESAVRVVVDPVGQKPGFRQFSGRVSYRNRNRKEVRKWSFKLINRWGRPVPQSLRGLVPESRVLHGGKASQLERTTARIRALKNPWFTIQLHCYTACASFAPHSLPTNTSIPSFLSCSVPRWLTSLECITWVLDGFSQWETWKGWESRKEERSGYSLLPLAWKPGPGSGCVPRWLSLYPQGFSSHPSLVSLFPLLNLLGLWVVRASCCCSSLGASPAFVCPWILSSAL